MKKMISFVLTICLVIGSVQISKKQVKAADTYTSGDYTYTLNNEGNAVLSGYIGISSAINIPNSLDGHKVVAISNNAFKNINSITSIIIPDSVTEIGNYAFYGTNLSSLTLPSNITKIGTSIMYGNTKIKEIILPKTVASTGGYLSNTSTEYRGPFYGSKVKKIVFENGMTKIPDHAAEGCEELTDVVIPDSVQGIGKYVFRECKALRSITLLNNIRTIGENAFKGCDNLMAYCNYFSNSVVTCIDQDITFAPSDERFVDDENKMIDRSASTYFANTNSLSSSGALLFSIKFNIKNKWKGELRNKSIVAFIPRYTDLNQESVKLDGQLVNNFFYNESTRRLTIPITADSGDITFSVSVRSKEKIKSYAYIYATKQGATTTETIGAINEDFSGISVIAPDVVSTGKINVNGIAGVSKEVDIYLDGEKAGSVTSLKTGSYSTTINISDPVEYSSYLIEARSTDEYGNDISAEKVITYEEKKPSLTSLKLDYYSGSELMEEELINIKKVPRIYYAPGKEFKFVADFENDESLETVYITSTRNNEKRSMEAVYDPASGLYVAEGYFDPDNKSYVPGVIGVEYNRKKEDVVVSESFNIDTYKDIISEKDNAKVTYSKNTADEIEATIDWTGAAKNFGKAELNAGIKYIDKVAGTSIGDIKTAAGITETALEYLVPGVNDKKYIMNIDFHDEETIAMVMYDAADVTLTAAGKVISMNMDFTDFGTDKYNSLFEWSERVSNISKAVNFGYSTYKIHKDYEKLITEIDQSSTIKDKSLAKSRALELKKDQLAFLAIMTVMPMLVAATPMAAPALVFSGLLAVISASSGMFWDMRIAQMKEQQFKLNWVVDPSGYVYDQKTTERIKNATVTAYWIPYDGTDDFWNNKPSNTIYGTVWDASEYEQENPMSTNNEGKYAWDVPEGWWRVKCEKEGYTVYWTDWMEVPPIQTDVNIGLMSENESGTITINPNINQDINSITKEKNTDVSNGNNSSNSINNDTKINIKNKKTYRKSKKITVKDKNGIKTIKLNKKTINVKGKKSYSFRLSKYKKYLKKKGKWNKLIVTDNKNKKKTIKIKVK